MKKTAFLLCCALATDAFALTTLETEPLPASPFADTESVTNVACAVWRQNIRHFDLALELMATPSNCVEVAFGRDADGDGVLSDGETGCSLGWDCGCWFARAGSEAAVSGLSVPAVSCPPATAAERKSLRWCQTVRRGSPLGVVATENGEPVFQSVGVQAPGWAYDAAWDTVRIAVRGVPAATERISVATEVTGFVITVQ